MTQTLVEMATVLVLTQIRAGPCPPDVIDRLLRTTHATLFDLSRQEAAQKPKKQADATPSESLAALRLRPWGTLQHSQVICHPHVHRRADRADVDQAKESIGLAIHTRRERISIALCRTFIARWHLLRERDEMVDRRDEMVKETFGPQLEQLRQWYDVVARGVEPGSEAHDCLERFVVAVDVFNDSTARDDTDHIIKTFDAAVALLKDAASARPRR